MNWGFLLSGSLIAAGALALRRVWPSRRSTAVATVAWVVFGLSTVSSALVPADVSFLAHTLLAVPGMFAPAVALFALSTANRGSGRAIDARMARWSFWMAVAAIVMLLLIVVSTVWGVPPGGAAQRLLYLVPHVALTGLGLLLWRSAKRAQNPALRLRNPTSR